MSDLRVTPPASDDLANDAPGSQTSPPATERRRSTTKIVALTVLASLALVVLLGVAYALSLNSKLDSNVKHEALLPGQTASAAAAGADAAAGARATTAAPSEAVKQNSDGTITDGSGTVYKDAQGQPLVIPMQAAADPAAAPGTSGSADSVEVTQPSRPASAGDAQNFLVIGTDSRGADRGRSDVMVLAHISDDRKRIDLVHFPRDIWTRVPVIGSAKLNAAYATGGAPRLVETLQPMIGVPIDHVAIVDFEGFKQMTDAIGGVTIGGQKYDGTSGLAWVRERKSLNQGDISRGQRQMTYIKAVLTQALQPSVLLNPSTLSSYIDAGTKALTVDQSFTSGDMRSLALQLRDVRAGSIVEHTAPWIGVGWAEGQSIVVPSSEQFAKLRTALQRDEMAGYVDTVSPKSGFGR